MRSIIFWRIITAICFGERHNPFHHVLTKKPGLNRTGESGADGDKQKQERDFLKVFHVFLGFYFDSNLDITNNYRIAK